MNSDVWTWAGEFRKTNKNIGVDKWQISTQLKALLDDTKYWIEKNTYLRMKLPSGSNTGLSLFTVFLMETEGIAAYG
jgi:fido (protein-threonine AMPylation protein)